MHIETLDKAAKLLWKRNALANEIKKQKCRTGTVYIRVNGGNVSHLDGGELLALRDTEALHAIIMRTLREDLAVVEGKMRDLGVDLPRGPQ